MANLIECDGGCGKVSPERTGARLHIANHWIVFRWGLATDGAPVGGFNGALKNERIFCKGCFRRIEDAMREPDRAAPASHVAEREG